MDITRILIIEDNPGDAGLVEHVDTGFLAYLANLTEVARHAPAVANSIVQEECVILCKWHGC